jgi:hypothetical protein
LVKLTAPTYIYDDQDVEPGETYYYVVKAVDAALNLSANSNEVSQTAEPKMVDVTFRVRTPDFTPDADTIHIVGGTSPLEWNPSKEPMTNIGPNLWEITLGFLDGTLLEYKYTRGVSWDRVEWWGPIVTVNNRQATISYGADGNQLIDNTDPGAADDNIKAILNWRDPLVAATVPADGYAGPPPPPPGVIITFARDIQPAEGAVDFSASVVVESGGAPIIGTVTSPDAVTLVWTPDVGLIPGTYTVTVYNLRSALGGDSVPMQTPYVFTFTVTAQ